MQDRDSIVEKLLAGPYAGPALVPASPWLDSIPPRAPSGYLMKDSVTRATTITLVPGGAEKPWLWVLRYRYGPDWSTIILPGSQTSHMFDGGSESKAPDAVFVSAVDRTGNQSQARKATIGRPPVKKPAAAPKRR